MKRQDKIKIKDLEVYGNHGVFKEENILGQKFLVSASLYVDTKKSGYSDEMEDSISYAEVAHRIKDFLKEHTFKLLEALAEQLAEELLLQYEGVDSVWLEIKKPWAPILLPLDTVSVEIKRGWHLAYLALGSNLGDKEKYLKDALKALASHKKIHIERVSSFIVTKPYGGVEQDDFLNGAAVISTLYSPQELLEVVHEIEEQFGRERLIHWGPRTLDLDILLYEEEVIWEDSLKIPHIELHKRSFVLEPLVEIAPQAKHPLLQKTIFELWSNL
jgi:dihydroneopterin aldolase/2-amino-4-hydroxy-6-hydroxymethyldihydropteridine diphosphokinase